MNQPSYTKHLVEMSDGQQIAVTIMGKGPGILCFSGFANSKMNYQLISPYLEQQATLYLIDNRGIGESPSTARDYPLERLAQDGVEVMAHFAQNSYDVMGISMGGFIAQIACILAPDKIKKLALLATKSAGPQFPITYRITEAGFTAFMKMDFALGNRLAVEKYVAPSFIENHRQKLEEIIELRAQYESNLKLDEALRQLRACDQWLEGEFPLEQITQETLVMTGELDGFITPDNADILIRRIPQAKKILIKDAAHLFFYEKPEAVSQSLSNFFNKENEI